MKYIYLFGDSITFGMGGSIQGGWVTRLDTILANKAKAVNFGIPGDTSKDLVEKFKNQIFEVNPDVIVFAIGVNDSQYLTHEGNTLVSLEDFKKNIKELLQMAKKITNKIVFVGLTNVDETKVSPVPNNSLIHFYNKNIKLFDSEIKKVSIKNNVHFVSLLKLLSNSDLIDGLHPNDIGYKKIAQKIGSFIAQKNII